MKTKIFTGLLILSSMSFFGQNKLDATGNVGIGRTNPGARLHIQSNPGQTEALARFQISDAPGDYMTIQNATAVEGRFSPAIFGHAQNYTNSGLYLIGTTTSDMDIISSTPLVTFDARRKDGAIQSRQLFGWQSYGQRKMTILANGNVGIGSIKPDSKLTVKGKIHCEEVLVDLAVPADYVFEKYYTGASELKEDYNMPSLEEVAAFTKENHHLPNVPSATAIQEKGLQLKEMTNLLLQKIEELTLYTIEQEKRIKALEAQQNSSSKQ